MSEYRRFVAYIYRYREGKREKNSGYVKVDARNGICRIQMRIQFADMGNRKLKIYGFLRKEAWLLGIPLGEAVRKNGVCEWRMNTSSEHFGESEYTLPEICGMWIEGEQQELYITVWDDEIVDVQRFTTELPSPQENKVMEVPVTQETAARPEKMTAEVQAEGTGQSSDAGIAERWQQFLYHYPGVKPFADAEIGQCIQIAPKDISFLGKNEWNFGRNPFLQQGYGRYGYLLVGVHKNGRFILGVPGMYYDEQDRHLARMYGFPEFKKADGEGTDIILPEGEDRGKFGYWYHYINEAFT